MSAMAASSGRIPQSDVEASNSGSEESASDSYRGFSGSRGRGGMLVLASALLVAASVALLVALLRGGPGEGVAAAPPGEAAYPPHARLNSKVGLEQVLPGLPSGYSHFSLFDDKDDAKLDNAMSNMNRTARAGYAMQQAKAALASSVSGTSSAYSSRTASSPGSTCAADEEESGNLCYKKCAELTQGTHPIRTSAFTCCRSHPCRFNQRISMKICGGFDVSGDSTGNSCPHTKGQCLPNEELHLGVCYKQCSLLTNGEYYNRVAAATCCKSSGFGCLLFTNLKTRAAFRVGGGDGNGEGETASAHRPLIY